MNYKMALLSFQWMGQEVHLKWTCLADSSFARFFSEQREWQSCQLELSSAVSSALPPRRMRHLPPSPPNNIDNALRMQLFVALTRSQCIALQASSLDQWRGLNQPQDLYFSYLPTNSSSASSTSFG